MIRLKVPLSSASPRALQSKRGSPRPWRTDGRRQRGGNCSAATKRSHWAPVLLAQPATETQRHSWSCKGAALFFFLFPAAAAEVNLLFWLSVHMIGGQRSKAKRWSRAKRWAEGRRSAPACLKHPGGQAAGQRLSSTNTHGVCQDPCRAAATHTLWEKHTENSRKHKHLVSSKQHTRPTSCCQFSPLQ